MGNNHSDGDWIGIIICYIIFWPLGLFLLLRKLLKGKLRAPKRKTALLIGGALAIWGLYQLQLMGQVDSVRWEEIMSSVFYVLGGGVFAAVGCWANLKERLYRKYRNIIAGHPYMSVESIAKAIPTGLHRACRDLQSMIDKGMLGESAYIDMGRKCLVLDATAAQTVESEFVPEEEQPRAAQAEQKEPEEDEFERRLREIRRLNDDIDDAGVSADIDRLEALTRSIFAAVRNNPEKRAKIHTFMDYYLPTTLKLLTAYAQLEEQPASGRNAAEAKTRIEGILKKLVECFEQLLDQLNRFDVIDIASDIQVLETMMAKDGIGDGQYTLFR